VELAFGFSPTEVAQCVFSCTVSPALGVLEPVLLPVLYRVEGVVPFVLDLMVDKLTVGLYSHSYNVASIIHNEENFAQRMMWLRGLVDQIPEVPYVMREVFHNRIVFLNNFPGPDQFVSQLWFPSVPEKRDWCVKLFLNVFPQTKLLYWVFLQTYPGAGTELWFLLSFFDSQFPV